MNTIAYCSSDLSTMRILTQQGADDYAPSSLPEEPTALDLRARVDEAAEFLSRQPGIKRRLELVVVDPSDTAVHFTQIAAPAAPIAAAAVDRDAEDWGPLAPTRGIAPLVSAPERPRSFERFRRTTQNQKATPTDAPVAVLTTPDAAIRLLLDRLDRKGFKLPLVASLYHLLATYTQARPSEGVSATVLIQPHRIVYALADEDGLRAGGIIAVTHTDTVADSVLERLRLDMFSWCVRLGTQLSSTRILTTHDCPIAARLTDNAALGEVVVRQENNPLDTLLSQSAPSLLQSGWAARSNRLHLVRLTHRPNRSTRRRYRTAAAVLLVLAGACGIASYRLNQNTQMNTAARAQTALATQQFAQDAFADFDPNSEDVYTFLSRRLREIGEREELSSPPPPPQWAISMQELFDFLSSYDDINIAAMNLAPSEASVTLRGDGITPEVATQLAADLSTTNFRREWRANTNAATSGRITLTSTKP